MAGGASRNMQGWYIGITAASQAVKAGSTPVPCSTQINIPRQSRGYFICGQSPLLLATRVTSRWYGLAAA